MWAANLTPLEKARSEPAKTITLISGRASICSSDGSQFLHHRDVDDIQRGILQHDPGRRRLHSTAMRVKLELFVAELIMRPMTRGCEKQIPHRLKPIRDDKVKPLTAQLKQRTFLDVRLPPELRRTLLYISGQTFLRVFALKQQLLIFPLQRRVRLPAESPSRPAPLA